MKHCNFKFVFFLIFLSTLIAGCGDIAKNQMATVIFGGSQTLCTANASSKTQGGVYVIGQRIDGSESISFAIGSCDGIVTKSLSFGDWEFAAFSWQGDVNAKNGIGRTRCAGIYPRIGQTTTSITFDLSSQNCNDPRFSDSAFDTTKNEFSNSLLYLCDTVNTGLPVSSSNCNQPQNGMPLSYEIILLGHHDVQNDPSLSTGLNLQESFSFGCQAMTAAHNITVSLPVKDFIPYRINYYDLSNCDASNGHFEFTSSNFNFSGSLYVDTDVTGSLFTVVGNGSIGFGAGNYHTTSQVHYSGTSPFSAFTGGNVDSAGNVNLITDFNLPNSTSSCSVVGKCSVSWFNPDKGGCPVTGATGLIPTPATAFVSGSTGGSINYTPLNQASGTESYNIDEIECYDGANVYKLHMWSIVANGANFQVKNPVIFIYPNNPNNPNTAFLSNSIQGSGYSVSTGPTFLSGSNNGGQYAIGVAAINADKISCPTAASSFNQDVYKLTVSKIVGAVTQNRDITVVCNYDTNGGNGAGGFSVAPTVPIYTLFTGYTCSVSSCSPPSSSTNVISTGVYKYQNAHGMNNSFNTANCSLASGSTKVKYCSYDSSALVGDNVTNCSNNPSNYTSLLNLVATDILNYSTYSGVGDQFSLPIFSLGSPGTQVSKGKTVIMDIGCLDTNSTQQNISIRMPMPPAPPTNLVWGQSSTTVAAPHTDRVISAMFTASPDASTFSSNNITYYADATCTTAIAGATYPLVNTGVADYSFQNSTSIVDGAGVYSYDITVSNSFGTSKSICSSPIFVNPAPVAVTGVAVVASSINAKQFNLSWGLSSSTDVQRQSYTAYSDAACTTIVQVPTTIFNNNTQSSFSTSGALYTTGTTFYFKISVFDGVSTTSSSNCPGAVSP